MNTIDGFYFEDALIAKKAEKEAETVRYIRSKTNLSKPDTIYALYTKLVDNQVMNTPVGFAFLNELYRMLQASGAYPMEKIPKVYVPAAKSIRNDTKDDVVGSTDSMEKEEDGTLQSTDTEMHVSREANPEDRALEEEARIAEAVRKRTQIINDNGKTQLQNLRELYRYKLRNSKIIIFGLIVVILGLLAMVYFSDASPFYDVEQQVIDKYSAWQEELTLKEQGLDEWEAELTLREQRLEEREAELNRGE